MVYDPVKGVMFDDEKQTDYVPSKEAFVKTTTHIPSKEIIVPGGSSEQVKVSKPVVEANPDALKKEEPKNEITEEDAAARLQKLADKYR